MAARLSFCPAGDLVLVFVLAGRGFDALLFQVSGTPDIWPVGGTISLLRQFDLDKLFRLGHSRLPRDRSVSSLAIQRTCGHSQSSPRNCGAIVRFLPAAFSGVPRRAFPRVGFASGRLCNSWRLRRFNVFSLFVSESVAPWYWWLSVPAGLAVLFCVALVVWWLPRPARRFLFYSASLLVAMALLGILQTKYLLLLSPWVLLPVGVAIETAKPRWATFALAAALLIIGGGRVVRNLFAALLFRAAIYRTLAGSCAGCGREDSQRRNGDRRPPFVSVLSHLFPARTQSEWALEI